MGSIGPTPHLSIHSFGCILSCNITTDTSLNNHMQYTMKDVRERKNLPDDGVHPHQGDLSSAFTLELNPRIFYLTSYIALLYILELQMVPWAKLHWKGGEEKSKQQEMYLMLRSHSPAPRTAHLPLVRQSSRTRCLCSSHRLSGTGLPGQPGGWKASGLRGCTYILHSMG